MSGWVLEAFFEHEVFEGVFVVFLSCFVEVVHVELSDEGSVVAVPEVDGQDVFRELFDFFDDEAFSAFGPADGVAELVVLNISWGTSRIS